jgi:hypothetical protein
MPIYTRCCIIDDVVFVTTRITTVYCSQKCRNKARSFSAAMLQRLIEKSAKTVVVQPSIPKSVRDFIKKHGADITQSTEVEDMYRSAKIELDMLGIKSADQQDLINKAKEIQGKKNIEKRIQRLSQNIDPEMLELQNSYHTKKDRKEEIEDTTGFGSQEPDAEMLAQQYTVSDEILDDLANHLVEKEPKKYKIRRIGGE